VWLGAVAPLGLSEPVCVVGSEAPVVPLCSFIPACPVVFPWAPVVSAWAKAAVPANSAAAKRVIFISSLLDDPGSQRTRNDFSPPKPSSAPDRCSDAAESQEEKIVPARDRGTGAIRSVFLYPYE